jgi:hypothetical protein
VNDPLQIRQEVVMTKFRTFLLAAVIAAAALGIALTAGAQQDKRPKQVVWEYRDGANLTVSQLNTLGADGWELVITTQYDKNLYYILKRQKP